MTTTRMGEIITIMNSERSLIRLMAWLSPVFPVGGFAYSAGLEQAVCSGYVGDRESLQDWISAVLQHGGAWNDAVILAAAFRAATDDQTVSEIADLAEALSGAAERHSEMMNQGEAFAQAASHWFKESDIPLEGRQPLPVVLGVASARLEIGLASVLTAYLHGFVSNQIQAAIRLSVCGQKGGAALLQAIEKHILACAKKAAESSLEDLANVAFMAEICAMNHETQQPRIFLS